MKDTHFLVTGFCALALLVLLQAVYIGVQHAEYRGLEYRFDWNTDALEGCHYDLSQYTGKNG